MARASSRSHRPPSPASSGGRSLLRPGRTDGFEIITAPAVHPAARLLGLLIRLRAELTTIAATVTVLWLGSTLIPTPFLIAIVAVTLAIVLATPVLRRFVAHRATAVVTRHRLRQVLVERRCLNFSRHAPLFLWSHPNDVGETVWLFLRAGISPADVEDQAEWIASGCFARDARVTPVRAFTALVRVEVIRRDPLARALIASELDDWAATTGSPPPRGAQVVPPKPGNQHWSGTSNRAPSPGPAPRPTLHESDEVPPVVIEHPTPAPPPAPAPAPGAKPEPVAVPDRGGDWSDYV